jgi:hypothetical protein
MRAFVVFSAVAFVAGPAFAQSRADQLPAPSPAPGIPIYPQPSEDTRDQPPVARPAAELIPQAKEPESRLVPAEPATDTISSRLLLSLDLGYTSTFGYLDSQTHLPSHLSGGIYTALDIGYGITRYVEVGLNATYASFGSATECPACTGKAYDVVGTIRYHLVQGVKFDPWVRTGLGFSAFQFKQGQQDSRYLGLHWLELTVGGDWYFGRNFGFGPLLSMSLASYLDHPTNRNPSVAARWLAGMNLAFDSLGK